MLFLIMAVASQAQVPLHFKVNYHFWEETKPQEAPFRLVVVGPDGRADTLSQTPLRKGRRSKDGFGRRYDRQLALPGLYRLLLTLDTCTLEMPFTLDGSELLVDAGLYVNCYDTQYTAYPTINLYRRAPSNVSLYYLGVDTARSILFNFVNHSSDTLSDGLRNHFYVDIRKYIGNEQPELEHHANYRGSFEAPLAPGRSRRLQENASHVNLGRCHATLCYTVDPHTFYSHPAIDRGGCVIYTRPDASVYWRHITNQIWYVATCDLFLTTLDLNP